MFRGWSSRRKEICQGGLQRGAGGGHKDSVGDRGYLVPYRTSGAQSDLLGVRTFFSHLSRTQFGYCALKPEENLLFL